MSKVGKFWKAENHYEPLMPENRINVLEDELRQLLDNIADDEVAVGDAMMVEYDREWTEQHGIGRFGRMTLKNGEKKFHAAPKNMIRESHMNFTERNFIDYFSSWKDGTSHRPPVDRLLDPIILPEKKEEYKNCTISYEAEMFQHLRVANTITLVNPSMSTLVALKTSGGGQVTLTSGVTEKWSASIHDFVNKSGGLLKMLPQKTVHGIAYLGSNEPLWFPDTGWLRAVINPFVDQTSYFQSVRVDMLEDEVHLTIRKKPNYDVYSILARDRDCVRYNPESVDGWLAQKKKLFWIESKNPLPILEKEERKIHHSPWFIDYGGVWQEIDGRVWMTHEGIVSDVRVPGTYSSRRRIPPPTGYNWVEYEKAGTHIVTYGCVHPFQMNGITTHILGKAKLISFDEVYLTSGVVKRKSVPGAYITDGPGEILNSDEGLRMATHDSKEALSFAYVDREGRFYSGLSHTDDGILIKLGGEKYLTPFVPGEVRKLNVFRTPNFTRIEIPDKLESGQYLLFPSNKAMIDHLDLCSMFTSRYRTIESIVESRADPEYGGFSAQDQTLHKFNEYLKKVKIEKFGDRGTTSSQMSLVLGKNPTSSYYFMQKMPSVWLWKDGKVTTAQFAIEESILIKFLGNHVRDRYDGQNWCTILEKLTILPQQGRMTFPFSPGIPTRNFEEFVRLNGFVTRRQHYQAIVHLIITKTAF